MCHKQKYNPMDESQEQIAAELAASQVVVKEDEVRANVIAEYGFDEVDDKERIDKLVAKEVESSKKLSAAIGQKIKHRTEAETLRNDPRLKDTQIPPVVKSTEDIDKILDEKLSQREIAALEYSPETKKEIADWAKFKGISVKEAERAPHIVIRIDNDKKAAEADEAAISRNNRSGGKTSYKFDSPPVVDMNTVEGRKTWEDYKEQMKKLGN